jgi:hypothetical protein
LAPHLSPWDWVVLQRWGEGDCSVRKPLCGEVYFGFLLPGSYCVTVWSGRQGKRFWLRLPPGSNVTLHSAADIRQCSWRRDRFRYFYNQM